jgi:hypothetical protein
MHTVRVYSVIMRLLPARPAWIALTAACIALPGSAHAQDRRVTANGYGHQEYLVTRRDSTDASFSLGEHSLFLTANINDRISFLTEGVVRFDASSGSRYAASIERALMRYAYADQHALIAGKVHTPVNYWNDVYHHGRLFFPTIDRPYAFSHFVPLHTLGLQLQGQNIGRARFGYDAMVGNGIASSDAADPGVSPAIMGSLHLKPVDGLRVQVGAYRDHLERNGYGTHSGHRIAPTVAGGTLYSGPLTFELVTASVAWFHPRVEFLNEWTLNRNRTDSLGTAFNRSNFTYVGVRLAERWVPYFVHDHIDAADNDLHTYPLHQERVAWGLRVEVNPLVALKLELGRQTRDLTPAGAHGDGHAGHAASAHGGRLERSRTLRLQLAYGF